MPETAEANPAAGPGATGGRLYALDWLRIAVFGLLILYHIGMFYVTWDWHVKSPRASTALEPLMNFSNPWRLGLLFLISGYASAAMLARSAPGRFARSRFHRLFWPLLFGVFVIVPPQVWQEVRQALGPAALDNFWWRYATASGNWCPDACLITPTWNHLWFVGYLLVYSLLLAGLVTIFPRLQTALAAPLRSPLLFLLLPWAWLAAARLLLWPRFGETHALIDDVYLHAVYLPLFLLGFALHRAPDALAVARRVAWPALALSIFCWAGLQLAYAHHEGATPPALPLALMRVARELQAWSMIVALLGLATRYWNRDHPWRAPLGEAVFPAYIVHQTIIIVLAVPLATLMLPLGVEQLILVTATFGGCFIAWQAARRIRWLAPLLGVKASPPARALPVPPVAGR